MAVAVAVVVVDADLAGGVPARFTAGAVHAGSDADPVVIASSAPGAS